MDMHCKSIDLRYTITEFEIRCNFADIQILPFRSICCGFGNFENLWTLILNRVQKTRSNLIFWPPPLMHDWRIEWNGTVLANLTQQHSEGFWVQKECTIESTPQTKKYQETQKTLGTSGTWRGTPKDGNELVWHINIMISDSSINSLVSFAPPQC